MLSTNGKSLYLMILKLLLGKVLHLVITKDLLDFGMKYLRINLR